MITVSVNLLAAGLLSTTLSVSSASAQSSANYPWCLMTGPAQSCFYISMAQCMASRRGAGDFCEPNNTYVGNTYPWSYGYRAPQ